LCVKDRDDPLTQLIAKIIIKVAQTGIPLGDFGSSDQRTGNSIGHLDPSMFGTATFLFRGSLAYGFGASQNARRTMTNLPAGDVFLTVTIMSVVFLTEVAVFSLIGWF